MKLSGSLTTQQQILACSYRFDLNQPLPAMLTYKHWIVAFTAITGGMSIALIAVDRRRFYTYLCFSVSIFTLGLNLVDQIDISAFDQFLTSNNIIGVLIISIGLAMFAAGAVSFSKAMGNLRPHIVGAQFLVSTGVMVIGSLLLNFQNPNHKIRPLTQCDEIYDKWRS